MQKIIELFYSVAHAEKVKSLVLPVTQDQDFVMAFKSLGEFQNTLYGAAALFVGRELYAWWKESKNKTGERLDRMEKLLHRLEVIIELRENERKK